MDDRRAYALVFWFGLLGGNYLVYSMIWPVRVAHHVIVTGLLVWWLYRRRIPMTPLNTPLALCFGAAALAALNAIDRRVAVENLWFFATNTLLFLATVDAIRAGYGDKLLNGVFVLGGVAAILCLVEFVTTWQRPSGPFLLINLAGGLLAALVVPVIGGAIERNSRALKQLAVLLVLALVVNQSRGALLSVGVALLAFMVLERQWRWLMVVSTAVLTLTILVLAWSAMPHHANGDELRSDLWRAAGKMAADYPYGVGPGLFGQAYRYYRSGLDDNMTGAHNLPLTIGAELGLLGIAAAGWTFFAFLRARPRSRSLSQNAALAALVGVALHMLVDNFPAQNFVLLVGLYAALLVADAPALNRQLAFVRLGGVIFLATALLGLLKADHAQWFFERSLASGSIEQAQIAVAIDPSMRLYRLQLAKLKHLDASYLDSTLQPDTQRSYYGLVSFGRYWE